MVDKNELRSRCRKKRESVTQKESKAMSAAKNILGSDIIKEASAVLLYSAVNSEMNTNFLGEKLLDMGKKIAFPRSLDNGIMSFHFVDSLSDLVTGRYGIREPSPDAEEYSYLQNTLCIVPGLAFTPRGDRLGYGAGYYDRFLAKYPGIFSVGFTFQEMILELIPTLPHDLKVNAVVTEERMVLCNAK